MLEVATKYFMVTPLHAACTSGLVSVVRTMLARGIAVDLPDRYGTTPLHNACERGREEVAQLLI